MRGLDQAMGCLGEGRTKTIRLQDSETGRLKDSEKMALGDVHMEFLRTFLRTITNSKKVLKKVLKNSM